MSQKMQSWSKKYYDLSSHCSKRHVPMTVLYGFLDAFFASKMR